MPPISKTHEDVKYLIRCIAAKTFYIGLKCTNFIVTVLGHHHYSISGPGSLVFHILQKNFI